MTATLWAKPRLSGVRPDPRNGIWSIHTALTGIQCSQGRIYQQPDGSWGALVIAGVKDDHHAALAAAEWAIAKLCA